MDYSKCSMIVTDRETSIEIKLNGVPIVDTHGEGNVDVWEAASRLSVALGWRLDRAVVANEDGSDPLIDQVALRIAEHLGIRCWLIDRAPIEEESSTPSL